MTSACITRQATLGDYLDLLAGQDLVASTCNFDPNHANLAVHFATADSREVVAHTLFVCKGRAFKEEYLTSATQTGAVAYVSEVEYPQAGIPGILVTDIRRAMGLMADYLYMHPCARTQVCALTGTKGKTTSAYYLRAILNTQLALDAEASCTTTEGALPTSIDTSGAAEPALAPRSTPIFTSVLLDDGITAGQSKLTTPEAFELERHLANAVSVGAPRVVMEISSQALKYDRCFGIEFAVAALTNVGEDHISPIEHPDFEDYLTSKLKIFGRCQSAVVNLDADHANRILDAATQAPQVITFSMRNPKADVYASNLRRSDQGITATVRTPRFQQDVLFPTPVEFNVANALCAITMAEALGVSQQAICSGFGNVSVPGRMQLLPTKSGQVIGVIDYAHNGMSLEALLHDLKANYPDRSVCVVFGATGGKGVDRRVTMGNVAGRLADRIVITEDDPGPEDPADIARTIAECVQAQGNANWQIVLNRDEAIATAVEQTPKQGQKTLLVVTGKGHETFMLRKNGSEPREADHVVLRRELDKAGF